VAEACRKSYPTSTVIRPSPTPGPAIILIDDVGASANAGSLVVRLASPNGFSSRTASRLDQKRAAAEIRYNRSVDFADTPQCSTINTGAKGLPPFFPGQSAGSRAYRRCHVITNRILG
jgi:hypothetical protein